MGGIFSFISMSDLNNLRKFITTTVYMQSKNSGTCIQVSMAQWQGIRTWIQRKTKGRWFKAHTVSNEIKRIGTGMLGEQGGNSRWGK